MQRETSAKRHKCEERTLELVGKAKLLKLDQVGFVEKKGRGRILRGRGHVEVFFPHKEDRKTVHYNKRVFLAQYAQFLG